MKSPAHHPLPFANAPYSRALHDEEWIFVSGTIGMDYETKRLAPTVREQTRLMIDNIQRYLRDCGGDLRNIVNYTLIISAHEHIHPVIEALAEVLPCKPTGTAMIAGIAIPDAYVEMQVIARRSHEG